jgi:hypothetical protein
MLLNQVTNTMLSDENLFKALAWTLGILFSSLVAIIVWLSKSVMGKQDATIGKQNDMIISLNNNKNNMDTIISDINEIYIRLGDVPELMKQTVVVKETMGQISKDVKEIRIEQGNLRQTVSSLQIESARNSEWIRLVGKMFESKQWLDKV